MTHHTPTQKPAFSSRIASSFMESGGNYTHSILLKSAAAVLLLLLLFCGVFCAAAAAEEHDHDEIDWQLWEQTDSLPDTAGSYYLTHDVTLNETWKVPAGTSADSKTTNLCLNGHVIKLELSGDDKASVIKVSSGATLNLYDCGTSLNLYDCGTSLHYFTIDENGLWTLSETETNYSITGGVITGGYAEVGGGVYVASTGGIFNMIGGNIVGNSATKNGGGVFVMSGGKFTMSGGEITGNKAAGNSAEGEKISGGGVYNSGEFNMQGGSITNNSATEGGGVYVALGTFTMSNPAKITGNKATQGGGGVYNGGTFNMQGGNITDNSAQNGGGVYAVFAEFNMSGGNITDNIVEENNGLGGGVYVDDGEFKVSGTPKICNNTLNDKTTANNVYLTSEKTITITGKLQTSAKIWVNPPASNPFETAFASGWNAGEQPLLPSTVFAADGEEYTVSVDEGNLKWGKAVAKIEDCGTTTYFKTLSDAVEADFSTPYTIVMIDDFTVINVAIDKTVTLDLAGHVLNGSSGDSVITIRPTGCLTLMDSNPDAVHKFSGTLPGKLTWDESSGTVEIKGGVITGGNAHDEYSGDGVRVDRGRFEMTGGSIIGNSAKNGGGVYVRRYGTFEMSGGSIIGNSAEMGSGVYVDGDDGTFTMSGGSITGNSAEKGGGGVYVEWGKFEMTGGSITKNSAEGEKINGGGVYVYNGKFTMSGGNITDNSANYNGGGVYLDEDEFTMSGGNITNNNAKNGGGVYVADGKFTMSGGNIMNNNASNLGGGVRVHSHGIFEMTGGSIIENSAEKGGGVQLAGTVVMSGGNIVKNSAEKGGGVRISGGDFTMSGGNVTENSASSNGGGVYLSTGTFSVNGTPLINDNTLDDKTTANNVYLASHKITVTDALTGGEIYINKPVCGAQFGQAGTGYTLIENDAAYFHPDSGSAKATVSGTFLKWDRVDTGTLPEPVSPSPSIQPSSSTMNGTDWMSFLPDSASIGQINIPGSHDASAFNTWAQAYLPISDMPIPFPIGDFFKCHDIDVTDQFESGVRWFDFRFIYNASCSKSIDDVTEHDYLTVHGEAHCNTFEDNPYLFFKHGVGDLADALSEYYTEFVVITYQFESDFTGQYSIYTSDLKEADALSRLRSDIDKLCQKYPNKYLHIKNGDTLPTLGEARGKIIFIESGEYNKTEDNYETDLEGKKGYLKALWDKASLQNYNDVYTLSNSPASPSPIAAFASFTQTINQIESEYGTIPLPHPVNIQSSAATQWVANNGYSFTKGNYYGVTLFNSVGIEPVIFAKACEKVYDSNAEICQLDISDSQLEEPISYEIRLGKKSLVMPPIEIDGYTIDGLFTSLSGGVQVADSNGNLIQSVSGYTNANGEWIKVSLEPVPLYVQWTANQYTVHLDANGGEGGTASVTATYGQTMPEATMPTKTGYNFTGYFDAQTGGTRYYNDDGSSAKEWDKVDDTTLYAQWTAETYIITLDGNGGTVSPSTLETQYGKKVKLVKATRSNHIHIGWALSKSGSASFAAEQEVEDLGDVTLYAVWMPESKAYNLTIKVMNADNTPASDANVELKQGSAVLQTATIGSDGKVTFTKKVPEGIYTLVVTDANETKSITQSVTVTEDKQETITLPAKSVKSKVEVSTKNGTPAVVVDGLAEVANEILNDGESVKASVEAKTEETASDIETIEIQEIKKKAAAVTQLQYLEINIEKSTTEGTSEKITNTQKVIEFIIPYDFNGKNIKLYRYHDNTVTELTPLSKKPELSERTDGTYWMDTGKNLIYLYTDQFSTYAIGVSEPQPSHSSSRDYGSSIWLQPTAEPTPIAEVTPEPTPAQPTASPIKPVPQASTPVPVAGILAGLGAAGVVFGLRRK